MSEENNVSGLRRSISWREGFLIAVGLPLAILPTIGFETSYLWGWSILLWALVMLQGFLQNMAFGELATAFPNVSGIPGFAQEVFKDKSGKKNKYDKGRLIGGYCAWGYLITWMVGAVYIMTIGAYVESLFPNLNIDSTVLNLILGGVIYVVLALIASRGLNSGAKLGLILAVFSVVPITAIVIAPFLTGNFHIEYITTALTPAWTWDINGVLMLFGLITMAQWAALGWEGCAMYGPEYKNPGRDIPKALFACGGFCLIMYVLVQASTIGTLGIDGVLAQPISVLQPVANLVFGDIGGEIAILFLIGTLVLLTQMGYSVSARALYGMAREGNMPKWLDHTSSKGEPMRALLVIAIINMFLISLGNLVVVMAASAIGYVIAFGIGLFAYVKAKRDPELKKLDRPYRAPRGWIWIAAALGILQIPFLIMGALYVDYTSYGAIATVLGIVLIVAFFPIWMYSQNERNKLTEKEKGEGVLIKANEVN